MGAIRGTPAACCVAAEAGAYPVSDVVLHGLCAGSPVVSNSGRSSRRRPNLVQDCLVLSPRLATWILRRFGPTIGVMRFVFRPLRGSRFDKVSVLAGAAVVGIPPALSGPVRTDWKWLMPVAFVVGLLLLVAVLRLYFRLYPTGRDQRLPTAGMEARLATIGADDFISGERFQALAELTIATEEILRHRSLSPEVGCLLYEMRTP